MLIHASPLGRELSTFLSLWTLDTFGGSQKPRGSWGPLTEGQPLGRHYFLEERISLFFFFFSQQTVGGRCHCFRLLSLLFGVRLSESQTASVSFYHKPATLAVQNNSNFETVFYNLGSLCSWGRLWTTYPPKYWDYRPMHPTPGWQHNFEGKKPHTWKMPTFVVKAWRLRPGIPIVTKLRYEDQAGSPVWAI